MEQSGGRCTLGCKPQVGAPENRIFFRNTENRKSCSLPSSRGAESLWDLLKGKLIIFDGAGLLISLPTRLVPSTPMCIIDKEREGESRGSRSRRREAVHGSIDLLVILERLQPYRSLGYPSIPFPFSSNNSGTFSLKEFMYLWQRVSYFCFLGDMICSDWPENYKLPLLPPPPSSPFYQPIT